ncbi:GTP cyclohydrolase II [Tumebacillus permanentifrigoris]|nr:GTP cyclohydrolase II [Tumebacillus permanentifrigoris]
MIDARVLKILPDKIKVIEANEKMTYVVGPIQLPVNLDGHTVTFQWYCWLTSNEMIRDMAGMFEKLSDVSLAESQQSSVLVYGDFEESDDALIRFHSICHTGDIFGSKRCDCGYQLKQAMKEIVDHGCGALFYLANHEGRGIGLYNKAMAYILQEQGFDTVDANLALGFKDDVRSYEEAIVVLKALRQKPVTLMTNNPKKLDALVGAGLEVSERMPLWGDVSEFNRRYLQTKIERSGHFEEVHDIG